MRILHFCNNALPESIGGVEQVIDQMARGTSALGVKNTVLSLSNSPSKLPITMSGYELFTAKRDFEFSSNAFSLQSIQLFKKLSAKADLIHYHFPWPFADLVHLIVSPNKPTIITYHSDIVRQKFLLMLYKPLMCHFIKSIDHIVATSPNYLKTSDVLPAFCNKVSVIPIGLDRQSYPDPEVNLIDYYKGLFGKRFYLFIGAFRYYKGLNYLIDSAKLIPYPIVIVGSGSIENQLKAITQKHGLNNVFFLGQVEERNKSALLKACYSVICPSHLRSEAFGVALLEGAMFCKPLISCEIGTGTSYINVDSLTGLVVPPSDPEALSNAMSWLWNHPDEAVEMGKNAYARYEKLFTARQMAESYFELYQNLINR